MFLAACSSSGNAGPACDPCGEGGAGAVTPAGHTSNPDGISYPNPAGGYGHKARVGNTPGDIVANLRFYGYLNGDPTKYQVVSLADYYDPCQKRYKVIHLSVAGVWCNPCNMETSALVAAQSLLQSDKVVVLQALSDGPTEGVGATQTDLTYWIRAHHSNFTEMLDPGPTQFGGFFIANEIPWNADVDPRTMELLSSSTGWNGDVASTIQPGLDAVAKAPPVPLTINTSFCNDDAGAVADQ
ncbi:MAG: hypothetical protein ACRENE_19870 [Polyangiaceae bacterium]